MAKIIYTYAKEALQHTCPVRSGRQGQALQKPYEKFLGEEKLSISLSSENYCLCDPTGENNLVAQTLKVRQDLTKELGYIIPKIQFIISTHAPLVMSSVEPRKDEDGNDINVVYRLEYADGVYSHKELKPYGLDANLILEEMSLVDSRVPEIADRIEKIKDLISEKLLDQASSQISLLEEETDPNQPVLVRLRAIINRLETLGK